jgi:starch synthase (maltosyl-transferring)
MGFDVIYLPPIHPIGVTHRKGRNNVTAAGPDDPGSPWAIGATQGGHQAIHPQLGTLEDFRRFLARAQEYHIEIALDLAFQCSPDHPYVSQHPEWFRQRPDGTVQYAENPPKQYQDIYPLEFETEQWQALWEELKSVVLFWIEQGVRIFRVDNPHTKPFRFWEWLIRAVKQVYPDVLFLAEAFTRPKVMYDLAKRGFTQSYTYFAWRNSKEEIIEYFTTLVHTEVREFFRPNLWPNTPDILSEYLQFGGRPAFLIRLVLAATLGASYGIYGPAFELCENLPREPGSEEYWHSEKYEIKAWDLDRSDSLKDFIARVNRIRRESPALHYDWGLHFHPVTNEQLLCYSKHSEDHSDVILVVVNLDPHHTQSGWIELLPEALDVVREGHYQVHDLLSDSRYLWEGQRNFVELNPHVVPAHIFRLRRRVRTERDFEYYL